MTLHREATAFQPRAVTDVRTLTLKPLFGGPSREAAVFGAGGQSARDEVFGAIKRVFAAVDGDILEAAKADEEPDCQFGGTTAVIALRIGQVSACAHACAPLPRTPWGRQHYFGVAASTLCTCCVVHPRMHTPPACLLGSAAPLWCCSLHTVQHAALCISALCAHCMAASIRS